MQTSLTLLSFLIGQVLMCALRDFNLPKIITDDVPIFMGLIGDLFPAVEIDRKRDLEFEKMVIQASLDLCLQPEETFILKVRDHLHVSMASRVFHTQTLFFYSKRWMKISIALS